MAIFESMSLLALEPLLRQPVGSDDLPTLLASRFEAREPRLQAALTRANEQTWLVLQVVLAGPAFWQGCHIYLSEADWLEFSQHAEFLRQKLHLPEGKHLWNHLRRLSLCELHMARKKGLLAAPKAELVPAQVAEGASESRWPGNLAEQTEPALPVLLRDLRRAELTSLARLVELDGGREPLLAAAMQHFFQKELDRDPDLLPGASLALPGVAQSKARKAFQLLADTMTGLGRGLQEWIEEDMSETTPSGMPEKTPAGKNTALLGSSSLAQRGGDATASEENPQANASEKTPTRHTARQWLLGWLVGLGGVLIPMLVVLWLFSRYMAHETRVFTGPNLPVHSVAFSPDGHLVAAGGFDGKIFLWDRQSGEKVQALNLEAGTVFRVVFSPNGETLLVGVMGDARILDVKTGDVVCRFLSQKNNVTCAEFSPDGHYVATNSLAEPKVHIWDARSNEPNGKKLRTLEGAKYPINNLAFAPDGNTLLASDGDSLCLWEVETGKLLRRFTDNAYGAGCVAFAPSGKQFAFSGKNKTIHLWDLEKEEIIQTFEGHKSPVVSIQFSPNGRFLVSGSLGIKKSKQEKDSAMPDEHRTIRVWSVATGTECYHVESGKEGVYSTAFAPDGSYILTGGEDKKVHLWWLP